MRKRIQFILTTSMLMLFLVGCARESLDKEKHMNTTTIEDVSVKPDVTPTDEIDSDALNITDEEEEIATETTVGVKIPAMYETILNNIYEALKLQPEMVETDNGYFSIGIHEIAIFGESAEDRIKSIAYCLKDVNNDGVEELLIVETPYQDGQKMRILDMYTLVDGSAIKVIEGWARNRYFILDDGMIYNSGSGGAAYSNNELFVFEKGAVELTSKGLYFTYPKDEDMTDVGYYYSENGVYDVSVATEISEEDYRAFVNDCDDRMVTFEVNTFDLYK